LIVVDPNTLKIAYSRLDAQNNTAVDLTTQGASSGNFALAYNRSIPRFFANLDAVTSYRPFRFDADNLYDIGATAAYRPRTGYFGTSVVTPTLKVGEIIPAVLSEPMTFNNFAANFQLKLGSTEASAYSYSMGRSGFDGMFYFHGNQGGYNGYVFGGTDGEKFRISNSGNVHVQSGDVYVTNNTKGIILKSPDNTCYRFTVANGGTLNAGAAVACP
jgi:hypothetical protein